MLREITFTEDTHTALVCGGIAALIVALVLGVTYGIVVKALVKQYRQKKVVQCETIALVTMESIGPR